MLLKGIIEQILSGFLIIAFPLILTVSCKNIKEGYIAGDSPTEIDLDSNVKHYSIASLVDNVKAVNLETNDNSIISDASSIERIIYKENKFFLLDDKFVSIKAFDSAGKYLYDLGKLGVGKGEHLRVDDIEYYPPHNSLMVLCGRPRKLSEFSLR